MNHDVAIASSWKNREQVRALANLLRANGLTVYDFTDRSCRTTEEIPPERYPDQFDPQCHVYGSYLETWRPQIEENRKAYSSCRVVILLLPAGNDSHADWGLAVGSGARSIVVGHPGAGQRTPDHLWTNLFANTIEDAATMASVMVTDEKNGLS